MVGRNIGTLSIWYYELVRKTKNPKVVVIGGGTGTFVVLTALRDQPVDLTAIISMMDSGGSNRVLRDEFGLLPTSDIRQCLVALAEDKGDQEILRKLFTYRFHQGVGISGMTFGNLFMAALADIYKDQAKALEVVQELLCIKGKILPVTLDDVHLVARYENGHQVVGEHAIDQPKHDGRLRIVEMETIPVAKIYPGAKKAILAADLIILGPGDLYTSLIPNLVVEGVSKVIARSKAKKLFIVNLMTRYGQTYKFTAQDHVAVVENYLGKKTLDFVLINKNKEIPKKMLVRYKEEKAEPVKDDLGFPMRHPELACPPTASPQGNGRWVLGSSYKAVRADLIFPQEIKKVPGDQIKRSILRHDPKKLGKEIMKLLDS